MVYVDDMYLYSMGQFSRMKMSHLIADTKEELLETVKAVGLNTKWIQYENTWKEHFDVSMSTRKKILDLGLAKAVTMKELNTIMKLREGHPHYVKLK